VDINRADVGRRGHRCNGPDTELAQAWTTVGQGWATLSHAEAARSIAAAAFSIDQTGVNTFPST
jgi:hypothetical protein